MHCGLGRGLVTNYGEGSWATKRGGITKFWGSFLLFTRQLEVLAILKGSGGCTQFYPVGRGCNTFLTHDFPIL